MSPNEVYVLLDGKLKSRYDGCVSEFTTAK